jgi:nuclease S1
MTPKNRLGLMLRRSKTLRVLVATTLATSMMVSPALAWGRLGHRVAGKIAEGRLNPAAKAAVATLLEPGETLADVSTWADEVRRDRRESGPWHYINIPITEPRYDAKFVPKEGCVVTKIDDFRKILADAGRPRVERAEALKFLAHFVEDMHQPVHVGHRDDRGGNDLQVQFFDRGSNLHSVWDSGLIERAKHTEAEWVEILSKTITPELAASWSKGEPPDWANESLEIAKLAYLDPPDNAPLKKGAKLGQPYQDANLPRAQVRVAQAGVRLAWILNTIFPEAPAKDGR